MYFPRQEDIIFVSYSVLLPFTIIHYVKTSTTNQTNTATHSITLTLITMNGFCSFQLIESDRGGAKS